MNDSVADGYSERVDRSEKLDLKTKLAYGAGDLGPAITANITVFFLLIFFTNVAGIPPAMAGSILMVGKIWDAINDPIVGFLTDKTKSRRWGRRLPWLLYGAVPFGCFFFLQWVVPTDNTWVLFWYYVIIGIVSQVFYTVVNLPYTAMTPELTQDYDERTSLNSIRFAFSIGGSILSLLLAQLIFSKQLIFANLESRQQMYLVLAGLCGVIAVFSLLFCVWGTRDRVLAFEEKRTENPKSESIPFLEQIKIVFRNKPFLFVIGIYLCSWLSLQITASVIPYYVIYSMRLQESQVPGVTMAVQGTALLMLFVWGLLSKKVGKRAVYFMGMFLWIIAAAGLFFLQPGQVSLMYTLAIMAGFGVSVAYLVPWSMMPDVIELDELQTGQRREGLFYGFMVLLQKFGLAFGLFLVGVSLQASGFQEKISGQTELPIQPDSALSAIRSAIGPIPIICLICGLFLTYFYPITREMHAEILLKLEERRKNNDL